MLGLLALPAAAEPWLDPIATIGADCVRARAVDAFVGDGRWEADEARRKLGAREVCAGSRPAEHATASVGAVRFAVTPSVRLSGGDAVPDGLGGDEEPGLVAGALAVEAVVDAAWFTVRVEPVVTAGAVPGVTADARFAALWGELRWKGLSLNVGTRDRWIGPGRHGALALSDNAQPPWLGAGVVEGRLPGWFHRLGRFRVEAGAGLLGEPRDDVAAPGLLLMDFRWLPVPFIEIGATRLSIFGGEGRPAVDIGQLLVPTEPHVYDDPDQSLPDQNELAVLDVRVTLPLGEWAGLPVDYVEGWWQYGGEDVIGRKVGPIPYPSLAGVGNLYGGAVKAGPIVVTGEYSALLDDYFRWYVGHRIYHDGFTQNSRFMGHFGGTDSETLFGSVAWEGAADARVPLRVRGWADWTRRVGVIEALNDKLFTFMVDEERVRGGLDAGWRLGDTGWISLGYGYEHVTGDDFVAGATADHHRVYVGLTPETIGRRTRP